jgi:hypothetical protein
LGSEQHFSDFLIALVKACEHLSRVSEVELTRADTIPKIRMSKLIEPSFHDLEIPPISQGVLVRLMVELLNAICASLNSLSCKFGIDLNTMKKVKISEGSIQYQILVGQMWKALNKSFCLLMRPGLPENQHLSLISDLQTLIHITGTVQLDGARDSLLSVLLESCDCEGMLYYFPFF